MAFGIPEGFAGVRGDPIENLAIVESFADLESDHAPLAANFLSSQSAYCGNVIHWRKPWCVAITGSVLTSIACEIASSEACDTLMTSPAVGFANPGSPPVVEAVIFEIAGAAGIGVIALPVVRGQLHGAEPQAVEVAHHGRSPSRSKLPSISKRLRSFRKRGFLDFGGVMGFQWCAVGWIWVMQESIKRRACLVSKRPG